MKAGSLDFSNYLKFSPSSEIKTPNEQKTQTKPLYFRVVFLFSHKLQQN